MSMEDQVCKATEARTAKDKELSKKMLGGWILHGGKCTKHYRRYNVGERWGNHYGKDVQNLEGWQARFQKVEDSVNWQKQQESLYAGGLESPRSNDAGPVFAPQSDLDKAAPEGCLAEDRGFLQEYGQV